MLLWIYALGIVVILWFSDCLLLTQVSNDELGLVTSLGFGVFCLELASDDDYDNVVVTLVYEDLN